jgi:hypothetical protein
MAFNVDGITSESTTNFIGKDGFFWWVGEVEDNEDPMEIGRVKVRILGYYTNFRGGTVGDLPTNYLPWATVLQHTSQAGNDGQGESSGQLQPGAVVMGFFMDGEYAQMPIVIGVMRVEKSDRTLQSRLFSFSNQSIPSGNGVNKSAKHPADINIVKPEAPLRQGSTNVVAYPGQKSTNNGSEGSPKNIGNAKISGSSSNPIKPIDPENPIPVANGVGGPWLTLEYKLAYLIEDLANNLSTLLKSNGYYLDMVTGKKVTEGDLTRSIGNYIGAVYAQIISAMRESLVNLATDLEKKKTLTYSNGVPTNVHKRLQSAISKVLTASCSMDQNLEIYVDDSLKPVNDAIDKYLASTLDKQELVVKTVDKVIESITTTAKNITTDIGDVTKQIKEGVRDVDTLGVIQHWESKSTVFALNTNLTEMHKTNLTGLMKVLATFTSASCERNPSMHLAHNVGWFPLYGVTHATKDDLEKLSKVRGEDGNRLFSLMFNDADPYLTTAKNYPNGAYDLYLGTPGRQGQVHKRANGTTHSSISFNNAQYAEKVARDNYRKTNPDASQEVVDAYVAEYVKTATGGLGDTGNLVADHITYAGVLTQEVHGDDCKLVNKDYVRTVEGDYYLKVSGNMHVEVGGGFFLGAEGYGKEGIQQHQLRFGSDVNMNVVGAKFELQSSESVISSVMTKVTGSMYENSCDQQNRSGLELNMSAESSIIMSTPHLLQLINLENYESPKSITGLRTVVRGGVELLMDPTVAGDYRVSLTNDSSAYRDPIAHPDKYRILRQDTQLTQF